MHRAFSANQDLAWKFGERYIDEAWTLAETDKNFRMVLDTYFGDQTRFDALSTDSKNQILAKNTDFADHLNLKDLLEGDHQLTTSLDALRNDFAATSEKLDEGIQQDQKSLLLLDARQKAIMTYLLKRESANQTIQRQIQEQQMLIDGSRSAVYLLSTFAGLGGNARLARYMDVVGNSAIQVADAINKYTASANNSSSMQRASSSVILMSSIVGVAYCNRKSQHGSC